MTDDVEQLKTDLDGLIQQYRKLRERVADLEETTSDQADRIAQLEAENERLRDTSELFEAIRERGATTTEDRAAVIVETLRSRAVVRDPPRYEMDAETITNVLQGTIKRPNAYPLMDAVANLVDRPHVLWKTAESRSSSKNTRLVLDLREGDVPATVAGHDISGVNAD